MNDFAQKTFHKVVHPASHKVIHQATFQLATGHGQLLSYPFPTVTSSDNSSLLPKFAHLHFGSIRVKWYGLLIRMVDGMDLMSVPRPIFAQLHQASSIDEPDHRSRISARANDK
ncbi:hypothetical protein YC2023_004503 [Brassica napus]